ncbi:replication initiator [Actinopolymorpha cephalotaxi]|uniref:replication initiator n=1 Tax=Actinopolymorpha cephalotaxi TaxID=504797 RepID=UPI003B8A74DE
MVRTTNVNTRTGEVTETKTVTEDMPDGVIYKACGNRRASVCPSCAEMYRADAYQTRRVASPNPAVLVVPLSPARTASTCAA